MPQMAPLNWLFFFMFFSITLIIFNIMNYFLINPDPPSMYLKSTSCNSFPWKW
uniref:ATP synthase complex subunit 8 n=1 Tax=Madachauliodes sp. TaxID=2900212 RepID=A0A8K1TAA4_9NEOP|nr:ATP synthase F0 subunit 8 [Madachauliodes sp.]